MAKKRAASRPHAARNRGLNPPYDQNHDHETLINDAEIFAANMARAAELWQKAFTLMLSSQHPTQTIGHTDPLALAQLFLSIARGSTLDTDALLNHSLALMADHCALWHCMSEKMLGKSSTPYIQESPKDRRFKDAAWQDSSVYDFIKQSYLINAQYMQRSISSIKGLDEKMSRKMNFFTRQFIDAMSPSNFVMTNPEVLRASIDSNGESLVRGLTHLVEDLERGGGRLRISMTDESAFTLGENIANTEGAVIYKNELIELIQYRASTDKVYSTPILITPAWINKYYILDLRPENSLVKWLTDQGFTVFIISWVNPDATLGRKSFADYLKLGPLAALDVIESVTKSSRISVIGYCLGGTLTAIMLAYLRAHGKESRIASATYLTTMVDFSEAGDLSVFIDDMQLSSLEERMSEQGFLDAYDMANTFNMLRANDLIWSFVVNNYLLGKDHFPFDLLYWNADSTRMPAAMHSFYLRTMYQQNLLVKPGGIEVLDTPINITKISTPSYVLSTREDHIAPWQSTYAATQIYDGPVVFTLADSGHIAGVINPPDKKKYCYWTAPHQPAKPEAWLNIAEENAGSWWPHWLAWQTLFAGKKIPARAIGNRSYKIIEKAPGSYARSRA